MGEGITHLVQITFKDDISPEAKSEVT